MIQVRSVAEPVPEPDPAPNLAPGVKVTVRMCFQIVKTGHFVSLDLQRRGQRVFKSFVLGLLS